MDKILKKAGIKTGGLDDNESIPICTFFNSDGGCMRGVSCKFRHVKVQCIVIDDEEKANGGGGDDNNDDDEVKELTKGVEELNVEDKKKEKEDDNDNDNDDAENE